VVRPGGGAPGKARLGCLFTLAVLAAAVYVGLRFVGVYFRYYQLQDEVKSQASFAPGLSDTAIRDRLVAKADTLGLPLGPKEWTIRRTRSPSEIVIHAEYEDSVVLQLFGYRRVVHLHFEPGARAAL
jgi:hypothetical protein